MELKSRYSQFVKNGEWKWWFNEFGGKDGIVKQALRQKAVAGGRPIEWHVMEPEVAKVIEKTFLEEGVKGIKVVNTSSEQVRGHVYV